MEKATEKLLDLLCGSQWETITITVDGVSDDMAIVPDGEHGPMLRISAKTQDGTVLHTREMDLSAVDAMIGKLIKMRDHMAAMKGDSNGK